MSSFKSAPMFKRMQQDTATALLSVSETAFLVALNCLKDHIDHDHTILTFGNGGSATNASHFASDLIQNTWNKGKPAKCVCASNDFGLITAISNDDKFDNVLSKRVKCNLGRGDLLVVFSVSGESKNIVAGVKEARDIGAHTLAFLGNANSTVLTLADYHMQVASSEPAIVEAIHLLIAQGLTLAL